MSKPCKAQNGGEQFCPVSHTHLGMVGGYVDHVSIGCGINFLGSSILLFRSMVVDASRRFIHFINTFFL